MGRTGPPSEQPIARIVRFKRDRRRKDDADPGAVRAFRSYSDVATEAGLSRIYAGQHTRIDHVAGLHLGSNVARFVLRESGLGHFGRDGEDDRS